MNKINLFSAQQALHQKAVSLAETFHKCEWELIEILREINRTKLFLHLGFPSLYQYAKDELKLTASNAYAFNTLARKSAKVPELLESLKSGDLCVSKAVRMAACINDANASELIEYAKSHTVKEIDFEVARRNPKVSKRESVRAESGERVRIGFSASKEILAKIEKVKNLLAQKGLDTDLSSVFDHALDEYLKRHDPVEKAKRAKVRAEKQKMKDRNMENSENHTKASGRKYKTNWQTLNLNHPLPPHVLDLENKIRTVSDVDLQPLDVQSCEVDGEVTSGRHVQPLHEQSFASEVKVLLDSSSQSLHKQSFASEAEDISVNQSKAEYIHASNYNSAQANHIDQTFRLNQRVPFKADEKNEVVLRDGYRCTFIDHHGRRCANERHLQIHHIHPVRLGGTNDPDNLTLLCSAHHELVHQLSLPLEGQVSWLRSPRLSYSASYRVC